MPKGRSRPRTTAATASAVDATPMQATPVPSPDPTDASVATFDPAEAMQFIDDGFSATTVQWTGAPISEELLQEELPADEYRALQARMAQEPEAPTGEVEAPEPHEPQFPDAQDQGGELHPASEVNRLMLWAENRDEFLRLRAQFRDNPRSLTAEELSQYTTWAAQRVYNPYRQFGSSTVTVATVRQEPEAWLDTVDRAEALEAALTEVERRRAEHGADDLFTSNRDVIRMRRFGQSAIQSVDQYYHPERYDGQQPMGVDLRTPQGVLAASDDDLRDQIVAQQVAERTQLVSGQLRQSLFLGEDLEAVQRNYNTAMDWMEAADRVDTLRRDRASMNQRHQQLDLTYQMMRDTLADAHPLTTSGPDNPTMRQVWASPEAVAPRVITPVAPPENPVPLTVYIPDSVQSERVQQHLAAARAEHGWPSIRVVRRAETAQNALDQGRVVVNYGGERDLPGAFNGTTTGGRDKWQMAERIGWAMPATTGDPETARQWNRPIIAKQSRHSARGENKRVFTPEELATPLGRAQLARYDMFQAYTSPEHREEYRVSVADTAVLSAFRRGSDGTLTPQGTLPAGALDLAQRVTRDAGLDWAGVDLMYDTQTQQWSVLEVNSAPGMGPLTMPQWYAAVQQWAERRRNA